MIGAMLRAAVMFACLGIILGFLSRIEVKNGISFNRPHKWDLIKGAYYGALVGLTIGIMTYYLR